MDRSKPGPPMSGAKARRWIVPAYIVLLTLVVPWYWPVGDARQAFGFPLWALGTLGAVLVTSVFTAWVYLSNGDNDSS